MKKISYTDLYALMEYHPLEKIRKDAGSRLVESYVKEGDIWRLEELRKYPHTPEEVRKKAEERFPDAVDSAIKKYVKEGNVKDLLGLYELDISKRKKKDIENTCDEIIKNWGKEKRYTNLINTARTSENRKIGEKALNEVINGSRKAIECLTEEGEWRSLIYLRDNPVVPEGMKEYASEKVPEAVDRYIEKCVNENKRELLFEVVANESIPIEKRRIAADKGFNRFEGSWIVYLITNDKLSEEIRVYVGKKLIERGEWEYLKEFSEDKRIPKELREEMRNAVPRALNKYIEEQIELYRGGYPVTHVLKELQKIYENPEIPEEQRQKAKRKHDEILGELTELLY